MSVFDACQDDVFKDMEKSGWDIVKLPNAVAKSTTQTRLTQSYAHLSGGKPNIDL